MKLENLTELSDLELSQRLKKIKTSKIIDAVIIGITVGVGIYSTVKNGLGFFAFFPLVLAYLIVRNSRSNQLLISKIEKELKSRS
jgi:predicted permease